MFIKEAPGLPPDPKITRWGLWINAVVYYGENLNTVRHIMAEIDDDDAVNVKKKPKNTLLNPVLSATWCI